MVRVQVSVLLARRFLRIAFGSCNQVIESCVPIVKRDRVCGIDFGGWSARELEEKRRGLSL
jgi:hypothetical protein